MDWLNSLIGKFVGLDTAPLIYFIEEDPQRLPVVNPLFQFLDQGKLTAVTSSLTLMEVLVRPLRLGQSQLADQYRDIILNSNNLLTLPVTNELADRAAHIRAKHNVRAADAIQLATALSAGATVFLTNDVSLSKIPLLDVLILDELRAR